MRGELITPTEAIHNPVMYGILPYSSDKVYGYLPYTFDKMYGILPYNCDALYGILPYRIEQVYGFLPYKVDPGNCRPWPTLHFAYHTALKYLTVRLTKNSVQRKTATANTPIRACTFSGIALDSGRVFTRMLPQTMGQTIPLNAPNIPVTPPTGDASR